MKNTKMILKVIGVAFLVTFLVSLLAFAWFRFYVLEPYEHFLKREQEIRPLLDALDTGVESQLPPLPSGSKLIKRSWYGLDNSTFYKAHGRWLTLEISTPWTMKDIFTYYRSTLATKGWLKNPKLGELSASEFYYRGRSCINISIGLSNNQSYSISIWHDYRNQTFSPEIPDPAIAQFFEFGFNMAECP